MDLNRDKFRFSVESSEIVAISRINVSSDAQVPKYTGNHQSETYTNGGPQGRSVTGKIPFLVSECPEGHEEMEKVAKEQRGEEGRDYFFLQSWLVLEMTPSCGEYKTVYDS